MNLSASFQQSIHRGREPIKRRLDKFSLLVRSEPSNDLSPPPKALLTEDVSWRRELAGTTGALDKEPDAFPRSMHPCSDLGRGNKIIGDDPVDS